MNTSELVPDNDDRMLLRVVEETFADETWRRKAPVVSHNSVTGARSDWAREHEMNVEFGQDSAALATAHTELTGQFATTPTQQVLTDAATGLYRLARPLEALEDPAWRV